MQLLLLLVLPCGAAVADERADAKLAKDHFLAGQALYMHKHYAEAIAEFESAKQLKPLPAFDFNIGRCHAELGQWSLAIEFYQRYLQSSPTDSVEVSALVNDLKERLATSSSRPASTEGASGEGRLTHSNRWLWAPVGVSGAALLVAAIGAGILGSVAGDFEHFRSTCAPGCAPDATAGLPTREYAGEALLGVAGALAITATILWIVRAPKTKHSARVALGSTLEIRF